MIIRILKDIRRIMDDLCKNLNEEIEHFKALEMGIQTIKNNQSEMKNTISGMKNIIAGINSRLDEAEN